MQKLVSIIIPVYNRESYILKTLKSVQVQTYKNWECIIIDDGSTDNGVEKIGEFISSDARFKLYQRPPNLKKGASSCRNYGLRVSKGNFIQFLDSDDLLHPEKLKQQIMSSSGNLVLLTGKWGGFTDEDDLSSRFKYKYNSYRNFKKGNDLLNSYGQNQEFFPPHVFLTPRKLIEKAGTWDEELGNNDDAEFFTRVILETSKIKFVPEAIAYYRYEVPGNLSTIDSMEKVKSLILSWKKMEENMKNRHLDTIYIQNAKFHLYEDLKSHFPEVLKREKKFFNDKKQGENNPTGILGWLKKISG